MPERKISYEIKEHLGIINKSNSGWNKELNLVSWNGNDAKYDIREWDEFHEKMGRGITLSIWEMQRAVDLYLKNNTDKAVARGRAIEEERRERMEAARRQRAHSEALLNEVLCDMPDEAEPVMFCEPEPESKTETETEPEPKTESVAEAETEDGDFTPF